MPIDGTRSVNYKLRRKVEPRRDDRFPRLNQGKFVTGGLQFMRSSRFEYGTANTTAHLQVGVGGIDDGVNFHFCDVLTDDGKGHIVTSL